MSIMRLWVIGTAIGAVLLLALGWFLGVQPRLAAASTADADRESVEQINAGYEATLVELRELSDRLPELQGELDAIRVELPQEPELSTFLGQLNALAVETGVSINEVTANSPVLIDPELVAQAGVTGFVEVPVTISVLGGTEGIEAFLRAAQFGPRLLFVSGFTIADDAESGRVTLTGSVLVLPPDDAVLPTAEAEPAPVDPATEPSADPSPSAAP